MSGVFFGGNLNHCLIHPNTPHSMNNFALPAALHRIAFLLIWVLTSVPALAQQMATSDLVKDGAFLKELVENGHPAQYEAEGAPDLTPVLEEFQALEVDSLPISQYFLYLKKALAQIGCSHTQLTDFPYTGQLPRHGWFPLLVLIDEGQLYFDRQDSSQWQHLAGQPIKAINGVPNATIVDALRYTISTDGGSTGPALERFRRLGGYWLALYFGIPEHYVVELPDTTVHLSGIKATRYNAPPKDTFPTVLRTSFIRFSILKDSIGVLQLSKFSRRGKERQALRKVFQQLKTKAIPHLILDLRGNPGGDRGTAQLLARHLVDEPFQYQMLQPKDLDLRPYLNKLGTKYWRLSRVKYNFGNHFKSKKTDRGRLFTYRFRPVKRPYTGQVWVLVDGRTASSSTLVTTWLHLHRPVTFLGTPPTGGYNGNNAGSYPRATLPGSKAAIQMGAYRIITDPNSKQRTGLTPDVPVHIDLKASLEGRDAIFEAALKAIGSISE